MAVYYVHNLREGSRPGNWLKFWEEQTGLKAGFCHRVGCLRQAEVGAHVQLDDASNDKWYIVPLCQSCNCKRGEHFSVTGPLVPVNGGDILW